MQPCLRDAVAAVKASTQRDELQLSQEMTIWFPVLRREQKTISGPSSSARGKIAEQRVGQGNGTLLMVLQRPVEVRLCPDVQESCLPVDIGPAGVHDLLLAGAAAKKEAVNDRLLGGAGSE